MNWHLLAISLAHRRNLTSAQKWFSRSDPGILQQIALVIMLLGLGLFAGWLFMHWQLRRAEPQRHHPMGLYLRLQRKLGLSAMQRWRLWRLARKLGLEHPAALLISEQFYVQSVRRHLTGRGLTATLAAADPAFAAIRAKLFK